MKTPAKTLITLLLLVAFGGAIEIAQYFVPTRSCDWHDLLADIAGIGLGICISRVLGVRRRSSAR